MFSWKTKSFELKNNCMLYVLYIVCVDICTVFTHNVSQPSLPGLVISEIYKLAISSPINRKLTHCVF